MKNDKRVQRTRRALRQALISLTLRVHYEAITIRDITAQAGVGYATFFRHYQDKEALLVDLLNSLIGELQELLLPADPAQSGVLLFRHAEANSRLYRALLGSGGTVTALQRVHRVGVQNLLNAYRPIPNSDIPPEIAAHQYVAAVISLLRWWLDEGMPYPAERMGEIYRKLAQPILDAALQRIGND